MLWKKNRITNYITVESKPEKAMKNDAKLTNEKMATHLKQIRDQENLTMRSLAERIGTPHSFVGKIEQQGRRMDVGEFIHYCKAMQRDPTVELQAIMEL
jgi:DNA-binding transcriptional regulator YiaG